MMEEIKHPHANDTSSCPKCGHVMWEHYTESERHPYQCWERMSLENNDFCGCRHGMPEQPTDEQLILYAIKNEKGEWYKTYSTTRNRGWKKKLTEAKIWSRAGQARAKLTALANEYPALPPPLLVEFVVTQVRVVDQTERVAQSRLEAQRKRKQYEEELAKQRLEDAQRRLARAQLDLSQLQRR